ncbi:hypothetical protein M9Y10_023475 [Tritrichomonas musculus]|uniref:Uncharacterized protein n=1 Tax=Tritrichomonas musculus TaxID=1915356 RepID=A0ABR2KVE8_9EUKA
MSDKLQKQPKTLQAEFEQKFVQEKLNDFEPTSCKAWTKLTSRFGPKISQEELLSLAEVVSHQLEIELYREYKRRKNMLIKWFDENLDLVWPYIEKHIIITDIHGNPIECSEKTKVKKEE